MTRVRGQNIFPPTPRFYWIAKVLGQNLLLQENREKSILGSYKYAINVNLSNRYSVAVHSAMDAELENNILFWIPNRVSKSFGNVKPADLYFVGLIPGLANLTYSDAKVQKFSNVQYYSKLFAGCHRDTNNIFMSNGVAKGLYNRYVNKVSGLKQSKLRLKDKFVNDTTGKLPELFDGLRKSCTVATPARVEAVWSQDFDQQPTLDIRSCILEAFVDFKSCINQTDCPFFQDSMLADLSCQEMSERLQPWIQVFENTIIDLSSKIIGIH